MEPLKPNIHERARKLEEKLVDCLSVNSKQKDIAQLIGKSEGSISKIKDNEMKLTAHEWSLIFAHAGMDLTSTDDIHLSPEELDTMLFASAECFRLKIEMRKAAAE